MAGDKQSVHKGQIVVSKDKYMTYVRQLLKKNRGCELPGTFNPIIVWDLFLEQCGDDDDDFHFIEHFPVQDYACSTHPLGGRIWV